VDILLFISKFAICTCVLALEKYTDSTR